MEIVKDILAGIGLATVVYWIVAGIAIFRYWRSGR